MNDLWERLREQFTLRALVAVGVQAVFLLGIVGYGLAPPSLGTKVLYPALFFLAAYAVLAWLTLTRPWDWVGLESTPSSGRMWGYFEPVVVYGSAIGFLTLATDALADAKARTAEAQRARIGDDVVARMLEQDKHEAWLDDTFGALIASDPMLIAGVAFLLVLAWFLLPR